MSNSRWLRIQELFQATVGMAPHERGEYLSEHCDGDDALRREIESLLVHDRKPSGPFKDVTPAPTFPTIAGYTIDGVVGHGGMGVVYRATQLALNRTVALKVLPGMIASASPSVVARFRREATAAAKLHHTNIVPIYDFGQSVDAHYYAMELIDGTPLDMLIDRLRDHDAVHASPVRLREILSGAGIASAPSIDAATDRGNADGSRVGVPGSSSSKSGFYFRFVAQWIAEVAEGLQHAHETGIIHRDIKPSNLILSRSGRIMICDFGLAKSEDEQSITQTGALIGAIRYLSPEQAMAGRIPLDHRTDIYSLGATMYELLTFQPAFPGEERSQVLAAIIQRDPPSPRTAVPSVPAELETICLKTLEKDPDTRYATASELAADLRRFLSDLPIVARPPTYVQRIAKFARRHAKEIATSLSLTAVLAAVYGGYGTYCYVAGNHYMDKARQALVDGNEEDARMYFDKAVNLGNANAKDVQKKVFASSQQFERELLESSPIGVTPKKVHPEVQRWLEVAALASEGHRWAEASAAYEHALSVDEQNIAVLGNYAILKKEQFNHLPPGAPPTLLLEGLALVERAMSINDRMAELYNIKGVLLKKLDRFDEAKRCYERVVAIKPEWPPGWNNLGTVRALQRDVNRAAQDLERAVGIELKEMAEHKCECWRQLGFLQLALGAIDDASHSADQAEQCSRAQEGHPHLAEALLLQSCVRLAKASDRSQVEQAKQYAWGASAERYKVLTGQIKRAQARAALSLGETNAAIQFAREALEAKPHDLECVNHLIIASAHATLGEQAAARHHLGEAIRTWPASLAERRYLVDAPQGVLWIDRAEDLERFRAEVEEQVAALP